jgi:hypothetical protein
MLVWLVSGWEESTVACRLQRVGRATPATSERYGTWRGSGD